MTNNSKTCRTCESWGMCSTHRAENTIEWCETHQIPTSFCRDACPEYKARPPVTIITSGRINGYRYTIDIIDNEREAAWCLLITMSIREYEKTLEALKIFLDTIGIDYNEVHTNVP